jgi:hypothetical protein
MKLHTLLVLLRVGPEISYPGMKTHTQARNFIPRYENTYTGKKFHAPVWKHILRHKISHPCIKTHTQAQNLMSGCENTYPGTKFRTRVWKHILGHEISYTGAKFNTRSQTLLRETNFQSLFFGKPKTLASVHYVELDLCHFQRIVILLPSVSTWKQGVQLVLYLDYVGLQMMLVFVVYINCFPFVVFIVDYPEIYFLTYALRYKRMNSRECKKLKSDKFKNWNS